MKTVTNLSGTWLRTFCAELETKQYKRGAARALKFGAVRLHCKQLNLAARELAIKIYNLEILLRLYFNRRCRSVRDILLPRDKIRQ